MTDGKTYVKGFKLDRDKLAKSAARYSGDDGDVDSYIPVLIRISMLGAHTSMSLTRKMASDV